MPLKANSDQGQCVPGSLVKRRAARGQRLMLSLTRRCFYLMTFLFAVVVMEVYTGEWLLLILSQPTSSNDIYLKCLCDTILSVHDSSESCKAM